MIIPFIAQVVIIGVAVSDMGNRGQENTIDRRQVPHVFGTCRRRDRLEIGVGRQRNEGSKSLVNGFLPWRVGYQSRVPFYLLRNWTFQPEVGSFLTLAAVVTRARKGGY